MDRTNKEELLLDLIKQQKMGRVLVFVGMKHKANKVAMVLNRNGIRSAAIHGNKSQAQRTKALSEFKVGAVSVLVATDIAARGIDVSGISHVVNFDLPNEPENYVHRIGRTARAGTSGVAYSFCCASDRNYLNQIERVVKRKIGRAEHKWHSVAAKNAEGVDAKPKKGRQGVGRGRGRDKRKSGGRGRSRRQVSGGRGQRGRKGGKVSGSRRVAMGRARSRR